MLKSQHADPIPLSSWNLLFIAWLIVMGAVLGSLFFSEIMHFAPCSMCWYQRILLYPLALMLPVGMFPYDGSVVRFALPLAIPGWLIAAYHTLVYAGVIPEEASPCSAGVSCTSQYIELFGFVSIPMLSLIAFTLIVFILVLLRRRLSS